jgi:hypothetical protein
VIRIDLVHVSRLVPWVGVAGAALAWSRPAAAGDAAAYLTPGVLFAPTSRDGRATGVGLELGSAIYTEGCCQGWGPVLQLEMLPADGPRKLAWRGAGELQVLWGPIGLSGGWAYRTDAETVPWATGPQIGAFFSVGVASIGVRSMIPVSHGPIGLYGADEVSLVLTFKTVLLVYGESLNLGLGGSGGWMRMPAGRPLVVEDVARVSDVVRLEGWSAVEAVVSRPKIAKNGLRERLVRAARGR